MLISTTQCRVAVLFDFAVAEGLLSDSMAALFETKQKERAGSGPLFCLSFAALVYCRTEFAFVQDVAFRA